ncbi:MAG: futalosine hydrolase [Thermodesulfobacteria bacterium]|nr:futalosine hydrolase [Thermodesulfobacteriota bacterium]
MKKSVILVASSYECEFLKELSKDIFLIGCGVVEAGLGTYEVLKQNPCKLAILAGIGGAYPESELKPKDIALAYREYWVDFGRRYKTHYSDLPKGITSCSIENLNLSYTEKAFSILMDSGFKVEVGNFATVCACSYDEQIAKFFSKRFEVIVENMEGFAVARACKKLGIPLIEVRAISNFVAEDRSSWKPHEALQSLKEALKCLLENL